MPDDGLIDVTLVDAADGQPFGRSELPAGQLPETFTPETRLDLGGAVWEVVRAQPADRAAFLAAGRLVLTLRRLRTVDPRQVAYSLPTLCADLPPLTPPDDAADDLEIHEDDWRQTELVERRCIAQVEAQLACVARILRDHARTVGEDGSAVRVFDALHLRESPAEPLTGALTRRRLFELLPVSHEFAGVALREGQGRVADSFAARVGPVAVYGRCAGDRVVTLGLLPASRATVRDVPGLAALMREFGLVLVDWCAARYEESA
ncbi:hypothetical protein ACFZAU_36415 [Streptomyces sp. NPDC008238]